MWTVTLDSNVPIITNTKSGSSSAREVSPTRHGIKEGRQDVEELLSSTSPFRCRSSSLMGRPPRTALSGRTRLDSRSASPVPRVTQSPRHDWNHGADRNDHLTARGRKDPDQDDLEQRLFLNSDPDGSSSSTTNVMLHCHPHNHHHHPHHNHLNHNHNHDRSVGGEGGEGLRGRVRGGGGGPMKATYDNRPIVSFPDSDSGFDSMKQRGGTLTSEDINSSLSARLTRSQSMSRLNGSFTADSLSDSQGTLGVSPYKEKSIRELNEALDDSASRRNVLVHKLKEAQSTLELQNDRLNKIEASAKENNMLVEDLRFKEREYRKKISHLEAAEEEKQRLQMENLRLREQMQDRVSALDFQLKSLKTQHTSAESENSKRISQLDSTTTALSVMEEENCRLQKDKEKLHADAMMLKEVLALTQNRFGALEMENRNMKNNSLRLREDNNALTRKVQEMAGQMIELRSLLQAVKDENERLSATWKSSSDDKTRSEKQIEGYQGSITDLKARLAATSADRDRLFQEKLQMNNKIQQMVLDKEQMMKTKLNLEDQLNEKMGRSASAKSFDFDYYEPDVKEQLRELASVKKVSEELSSELSSVKAFYERALEQIASLERNKSMLQSQQELGDQERRRLQSEVDRLNLALNSQSYDGKREQDYQEEMIQKLRIELKQTRYEKNTLENKTEELETKLSKADEGLREGTALQHSEMDNWKQTCERLTTSVSWKESELRNLTERNHELEDTMSGLRLELRAVRDKCDMLSDKDEEVKRFYEENKRLIQEKAENEQMIKLLETQKEVLSKNSEGSINKVNEIESLSLQMDQIRNENQLLRKKIIDLEQERDDAVFQKDELMASNECVFKSPSLVELEAKMEELREANKQLREMNETLSRQMEEERCKESSPESTALRKESEALREENSKLKSEVSGLKHEYGLLDAKHQRFVINYGHDGEQAAKEKQDMIQLRKEKDAIQKQVTLLQGQISLMEGSKKRADDQIAKLMAELSEVRAQLKQTSSIQAFSGHDPEAESLRKEVEGLKNQLASAKETQKVQEKMMESLREESLEDVGVELHQMRDELQQLMKVIQSKEQTIENLEAELKREKEQHDDKSEEIERCRTAMGEMERENRNLRQDVQEIRDMMAAELEQEQQEQSLKRSKSEKSLQEELIEALRAKENRAKTKPSGAFLSKSMNELQFRPASAPPMSGDTEEGPPKSATEGSDRLQSLISKYRSHGDKDGSTTGTDTQQIKPLPGFVTSKIVSKSRFGVTSPKAPMRRSTSGDETPISPLAKPENDSSISGITSNVTVKKAKKLPPPPPPKPASSSSSSSTKSSFMRSLTEGGGVMSPSAKSSSSSSLSSYSISASPPTLLQSKTATSMTVTKISATTPASTAGTLSSSLQPSLFTSSSSSLSSPSSSLSKTAPSPLASGSASSLSSSSGIGMSASSTSETLGDSQEQKDINALIQKRVRFKLPPPVRSYKLRRRALASALANRWAQPPS